MKKLLLIFAAVAAISCGDNTKKDAPKTKTIGSEPIEKTTPVTEERTSSDLTIEGNDQMQFNKKELRVKEGEKITLTLKHVGKMDKSVMGHNWVLLTQGTDRNEFGQEAATAEKTDYIPENMEDKVIAHTKMIGGGETTTVEFTAPAAGTYDYICSFPGHVALMHGKLIVEK